MNIKTRLTAIGAALGMLILILDSQTALHGASEGVELCLKTVIPSLFPFFILSSLLTGALGIASRSHWGRFLGIPKGGEGILLAGLLGGYPIGARCIGEAVRQGRLESRDGARMMAFCNNPGPGFIFGIAGALFDDPRTGWVLWAIQVTGAITVALLTPGRNTCALEPQKKSTASLPASLHSALGAMAGVCGWVVLFRVVICFLERWVLWLAPVAVRITLCGMLELTNGCCMLRELPDHGLRFVVCTGLLSFGGLCVWMQTISVAGGVSRKRYLPGKLLHCMISTGLAFPAQGALFEGKTGFPSLPMLLCVLLTAGITVFFRRKMKNRSGISEAVGV